ncbi:hypothetical protein [Nonomuraea dietziae]|uniref:hypothetical protein n=1 Tax=Nonomuraea dietziae TaxID=65515 RepID=UPI0031CEC62D
MLDALEIDPVGQRECDEISGGEYSLVRAQVIVACAERVVDGVGDRARDGLKQRQDARTTRGVAIALTPPAIDAATERTPDSISPRYLSGSPASCSMQTVLISRGKGDPPVDLDVVAAGIAGVDFCVDPASDGLGVHARRGDGRDDDVRLVIRGVLIGLAEAE